MENKQQSSSNNPLYTPMTNSGNNSLHAVTSPQQDSPKDTSVNNAEPVVEKSPDNSENTA